MLECNHSDVYTQCAYDDSFISLFLFSYTTAGYNQGMPGNYNGQQQQQQQQQQQPNPMQQQQPRPPMPQQQQGMQQQQGAPQQGGNYGQPPGGMGVPPGANYQQRAGGVQQAQQFHPYRR